MSRVGQVPVQFPEGVEVTCSEEVIAVSGPLGALEYRYPEEVSLAVSEREIVVAPRDRQKRSRQMWGTARSRIQNLVTGVTAGFEKNLELVGVGYRAEVRNDVLQLNLGYSHEISYRPPEGVRVETPRPTEVRVSGIDRVAVGQAAAEIRRFRPPEPYKGKGVKYRNERLYRKSPRKVQAGS